MDEPIVWYENMSLCIEKGTDFAARIEISDMKNTVTMNLTNPEIEMVIERLDEIRYKPEEDQDND